MDGRRTTKDFAKGLRRRMTLPEVLLWRALKGRRLGGLRFRRQHPIGPYVLDFYCDELKFVVEVDGESHSFEPDKDARRDEWLAGQGLRVFRIRAVTVLASDDAGASVVLDAIREQMLPLRGSCREATEGVAGRRSW